jgi:hypothetical protein
VLVILTHVASQGMKALRSTPDTLVCLTCQNNLSENTLHMLKVGALQPLINVVQSGQDTMLILALTLFKTFATDGTGERHHSMHVLAVCLTLRSPRSPSAQGVGKSDVRDSPAAASREQAAQAVHPDHAVGADPGVKR